MQYVIIGGSFAAVGAVEGIRAVDPDGSVTVVADEGFPAYSRPLISYLLAGKTDPEKVPYKDAEYADRLRVNLIKARAVALDGQAKTVRLNNGQTLGYDRLLLAVGGKPALFHTYSQMRENVVGFYTLADAERVQTLIRAGSRAVVIGAGLVGLKAAEALHARHANVTVVDLAETLLNATLDQTASDIVKRHLEQQGIAFRLGVRVVEVTGNVIAERVILSSGESLSADLVVIAAGSAPDLELSRMAGLSVKRGILVDECLETSVPGIYAAGDVAEAASFFTGEKTVNALLPAALEQGRAAGRAMAGKPECYRGTLPLNSTRLLGLTVMSAGQSKEEGLTKIWPDRKSYRKVVFRDGVPVGLIAVNKAEKIGIITDLIRRGVNVSGSQELLLGDSLSGMVFDRCFSTGMEG
ncbi:MAG: NAD(P)/FAD-dependent oxidoreductase [Solirubrobacterales bacterium]